MTADCIFCKIIRLEIPATIVYEDERTLVFRDLNPQAPTHLLIIPKKHFSKLSEMREEDCLVLGHLHWVAKKIAAENNLGDFRLTVNNGVGAGQTVWHLHLHLLAGRVFGWPPG